ncbi:MAG TPA: Rap1a/Tai family immunity protein [Acetobacteraceae bacterium]|nr:Rap1a/Tai family immunity protein [Acetobacteraceae bacterium]
MNLPRCLAVALIGTALVPAAHAQRATNLHAKTAGELAELCAANPRSGLGDAQVNYCHGFAQGAVDVMLHDAGNKRPFCFPSPTPTRTETLNQFVRWVRSDSSHASLPAAGGLYQFLTERYPCGK